MLDVLYCIREKCVKHYYYSNVVLFYRPVAFFLQECHHFYLSHDEVIHDRTQDTSILLL